MGIFLLSLVPKKKFSFSPKYLFIVTLSLIFPREICFLGILKKWIVGIFKSMAEIPYWWILKFNSQHSIEVLGIFSFYLVFGKEINLSPKYISIATPIQLTCYWGIFCQEIANPLQIENLSIDHKVGLHAYISNNLSSQISKLVSKSGQS